MNSGYTLYFSSLRPASADSRSMWQIRLLFSSGAAASRLNHRSIFTPASLITFDQLAISARMKSPNSSGVVGDGSL